MMVTGEHGPHLRREREDAGLTQEAVAQAMGVTRQTLWRYEGMAYVKARTAERYRAAIEKARAH